MHAVPSKRLRSAVHSIAHHGISNLSCLHPHLAECCRRAGRETASIDLMAGTLETQGMRSSKPLRSACEQLKHTFIRILESEQIDPDTLRCGTMDFQFRGSPFKDFPLVCHVRVNTENGRIFETAVGWDGHVAEILK